MRFGKCEYTVIELRSVTTVGLGQVGGGVSKRGEIGVSRKVNLHESRMISTRAVLECNGADLKFYAHTQRVQVHRLRT